MYIEIHHVEVITIFRHKVTKSIATVLFWLPTEIGNEGKREAATTTLPSRVDPEYAMFLLCNASNRQDGTTKERIYVCIEIRQYENRESPSNLNECDFISYTNDEPRCSRKRQGT
jgi:hypothetical protein